MKTSSLLEARENAHDQVTIDFSLYLIGWEDSASFSGPITAQSKAKPKQSRIISDTQLKIALYSQKHTHPDECMNILH